MALSTYRTRTAPGYSGSKGEQTVSYEYRIPRDELGTLLPAFDSSVSDAELGTVYFVRYTTRDIPGDDDYLMLTLTYSDSTGRNVRIRANGDDLYLPSATTREVPIEQAPNYLTKWNYDLYQRNDLNGTVGTFSGFTEADYDEATDTEITPSDPEYVYMWAKYSPGDNWTLIKPRTKPGVEAYRVPAVVVNYYYWDETKSTVEAQLQTVAQISTPGETFGYAGEWLVTGVDITEDGARYQGRVEYTNDPDWDNDLYEGS